MFLLLLLLLLLFLASSALFAEGRMPCCYGSFIVTRSFPRPYTQLAAWIVARSTEVYNFMFNIEA